MRKSSLPSVRRAEQTLVRQSVEMTFARYDYTAIEKRIRYALTYLAFMEGKGKGGEDTPLGRVEMDEYHQRYATIPIRILMGASRSHNYDDVRSAVDSFNSKTVWLSDGEGGWFKAYPLVAAYVRKIRGNVILKIDRSVWKTFARESRHYTEYDIMQALQFRSPLTMRLYEIANTLTGPGEFTLSYLKDIFCYGGPDSDNGPSHRLSPPPPCSSLCPWRSSPLPRAMPKGQRDAAGPALRSAHPAPHPSAEAPLPPFPCGQVPPLRPHKSSLRRSGADSQKRLLPRSWR